jgi:3-hydroxymyristoyl/3-hydroxydecanoyl-(acyl carrier protein) dehydratase
MQVLDDLTRKARRRPLFAPPRNAGALLDRTDIERILPHRDPMLLVDRVTHLDLDTQRLCAERFIDPQDPILRGHFPDYPVYPGALLVEAMGQAGLCLIRMLKEGRTTVLPEDQPHPVRLLKVHHALFQAEVRPEQTVQLLAQQIEENGFTATCLGQAVVDGSVCALTVMDVYFVDPAEMA